ncbi:MAG: hypothetical protein FJX76_15650 [Armatimonadetes bacterium]|nr:hypothetical protein [Armatimonadota bacterium]
MNFQEQFERAMRETRILRHRRSRLQTVGTTELPYVLLGESLVNLGDTVVRRGLVRVEQPNLFLFNRPVQLEGFEDEEDPGTMLALGRAASFPPGKYFNIDTHMDIYDGPMDGAITSWQDRLDNAEDVLTGLLTGPVDAWPMSLMFYTMTMIGQNAPADVNDLLFKRALPPHWS